MSILLGLAMSSAIVFGSAPIDPPSGFAEADFLTWQQQREAGLRKPDGWLSLVGLVWLEPGRFSVGSGADQHYQLNTGPAALGTLILEDDHLWFEPEAEGLLLNDKPVLVRNELQNDSAGKPSKLSFGDAHFLVIKRGERWALRVKDSKAETLLGFQGNQRYGFDPDWVIRADWQPFPEPRTLEITTIIGTVEPTPSLGIASFEHQGQRYQLQPTQEDEELFFVFGDRTNGKETYGMARFLYAKLTADGKHVVLDFNRAYNPPCAFTPYATCPMPPDGNRLDLAVTAGEKKYVGSEH